MAKYVNNGKSKIRMEFNVLEADLFVVFTVQEITDALIFHCLKIFPCLAYNMTKL